MKASKQKAEGLRKASLEALEKVSEAKSHFYSVRRVTKEQRILDSAKRDIQKALEVFEIVKTASLRADFPNIHNLKG